VQLLPAGHRLLPRARHILEAVANVRRLALDGDDSPVPKAIVRRMAGPGTADPGEVPGALRAGRSG
jgi:DNA-binding transcriptional LysR family regulator